MLRRCDICMPLDVRVSNAHLTDHWNPLCPFTGKYRVLLVSDVAARGLDIPECDAVFHLELPSDAAHYAHRAGRTGRAGRSGIVVSLTSEVGGGVLALFW